MNRPPASYVVVRNADGRAIFETFRKSIADKVNTERYTAVPILDYLGKRNARIKANGGTDVGL